MALTQVLSRVKYLGSRRVGPKTYWSLMGWLRPVPAVTSQYSDLASCMASGQQVVDLLAALGVLHPDAVTLHIGSGLGRVELHLRAHVKKCYGVDISPTMVKRARANVPHNDVEFHETDGTGLSQWPDRFFDLVYCFLVFQHVPRAVFRTYVADVGRTLAVDGHFVFQLMIDETGTEPEPPANHPYGLRYYRREDVEEVLAAAGFQVVQRTTLDGKPDDGTRARGDVVFCARLVG